MAISKKSYLVVAKESTPGTAILTGPALFSVPAKSNIKAVKNKEYPEEERGDRNAYYQSIDTTRESEIEVKGSWYNDVDPLFLLAFYGQDTVTQPDATNIPTVYLHTLSFLDIPPSLTIHKHYDSKAYYTAYSVLEKLVLKFSADEKTFERDATLKGLWPIENAAPPLRNFSTVNAMAGYKPIITIGGSSTTDISEFEIEMSQEISLWHPCSGTPDWTRADFGAREIKLSFTARFDNDDIYKRYRNSQNDSFGFVARGELIGSHDGTDYYQELAMTFPLVCYDSMEHDLGETNVLIKAEASVLPSAGSLTSLCAIQNTIASY